MTEEEIEERDRNGHCEDALQVEAANDNMNEEGTTGNTNEDAGAPPPRPVKKKLKRSPRGFKILHDEV